MALPKIDNIDSSLMEEFFADFNEAYQECEDVLIQLEISPEDTDLLNALFRSVHTIKGNLVYVGLEPISPLLQALEDVLDEIRNQRLQYDSSLSDVILISMDCTKSLINEQIHGLPNDIEPDRFNEICAAIQNILKVAEHDRSNAIHKALVVLDPSIKLTGEDSDTEPGVAAQTIGKATIPPNILELFSISPSDDLQFFRSLMPPLESRSLYWVGRNERQLYLALTMNQHANSPVDPTQLAASVYMHDFGMAFIPLEILHKKNQLGSTEKRLVHGHARVGYDVLHRMCHWEQAAEIVLQHHERVNGTGYPQGSSDVEICDGAKILSIVDAFDAKTHERAHTDMHKRPFIRAILEINRQAGLQFNQIWVNNFNQVMNGFEFST